MTKMCRLQLAPHVSTDLAWELLENANISVAYSEEDAGQQILHTFYASEDLFKIFDWIENIQNYDLPAIDWESQWQIHGMDFKDGYVHVDLNQMSSYKTILKLQPGPGFGDLSHPSTRLILKLMPKYLHQQIVVDIGCGSGVLALAATAMNASHVYGIDIDETALKHSQENAKLNEMHEKCHFMLPEEFNGHVSNSELLILMNMIMSEQQVAWESLPSLHYIPATILTSGVLEDEREIYLKQASRLGWQMIEEVAEEGWLGFCFQQFH